MRAAFFALPAFVLLSACVSNDEQPESPAAGVELLRSDPELERELELLDPRVVQAGQERALHVTVRNKRASNLAFDVAVVGYDVQGAQVPLSGGAWTRVELEANAQRAVQFASMPMQARSWQLRFQKPH